MKENHNGYLWMWEVMQFYHGIDYAGGENVFTFDTKHNVIYTHWIDKESVLEVYGVKVL